MIKNPRFFTMSLVASFVLAGHALAQKSTIETQLKGPDGKPATAASIQIDRQDRKAAPVLGRTDSKGRFVNSNLEPGTYKVTILIAGVPTQTQVVTTSARKPVLIAIEPKSGGAGASPVKKKIYRWVEGGTGTHMGGHYEEQGVAAKDSRDGAQNVENVNAAALQRPMTQSSVPAAGGR